MLRATTLTHNILFSHIEHARLGHHIVSGVHGIFRVAATHLPNEYYMVVGWGGGGKLCLKGTQDGLIQK